MPTWGEILKELQASRAPSGSGPDFDAVRRGYLQSVYEHTGRPVILYSSAWLSAAAAQPEALQITLEDIQGFMEVLSNIEGPKLDLIVHSPGGSAEAAESIVEYLRQRFTHIRVFVPLAAMSAATMVALAADEIILGQHSQLGPIDPQFIIQTPEGPRSAPAKAILNQFNQAKKECEDPRNLPAWLPILRSYAPGLLNQCQNSRDLAAKMVESWLARYMFQGRPDAEDEARRIADWFSDYDEFQSHGRRVGVELASQQGLRIKPLEEDDETQDRILSVHHATMHTFAQTPALKIIENHLGRSWVLLGGIAAVPGPPQHPPVPPNRAERRRQPKRR